MSVSIVLYEVVLQIYTKKKKTDNKEMSGTMS